MRMPPHPNSTHQYCTIIPDISAVFTHHIIPIQHESQRIHACYTRIDSIYRISIVYIHTTSSQYIQTKGKPFFRAGGPYEKYNGVQKPNV